MRIADEAEHRTGRKVAWGARCGDEEQMFTALAVPVMTRLRMPERQVLDTLVGAGVARSRVPTRWRGACASCATTRASGSTSCATRSSPSKPPARDRPEPDVELRPSQSARRRRAR